MSFKIVFQLPTRKYSSGDKKMISWRLPEELLRELDKAAKERGWTTTDTVTTALDQFIQWHKKT